VLLQWLPVSADSMLLSLLLLLLLLCSCNWDVPLVAANIS
jgi:hypothetical protein